MIQPVAHCDNVEIERLSASELSPADFHTKYFRLAKPVVITGATDQWQARKWTIENLVQRVGDNKVSFRQLYLRGSVSKFPCLEQGLYAHHHVHFMLIPYAFQFFSF